MFLLAHYFEDMVELQRNAIAAARAAGVTHEPVAVAADVSTDAPIDSAITATPSGVKPRKQVLTSAEMASRLSATT